jgi:hypothetical protein
MEQKLHTPINPCVSMMSRRDRKWASMGKSQCEMDMRIMHLIIQVTLKQSNMDYNRQEAIKQHCCAAAKRIRLLSNSLKCSIDIFH